MRESSHNSANILKAIKLYTFIGKLTWQQFSQMDVLKWMFSRVPSNYVFHAAVWLCSYFKVCSRRDAHLCFEKVTQNQEEEEKLEQGIICIQANHNFSILKVLENNTNKSEISNSSAKTLNTLRFSIS